MMFFISLVLFALALMDDLTCQNDQLWWIFWLSGMFFLFMTYLEDSYNVDLRN